MFRNKSNILYKTISTLLFLLCGNINAYTQIFENPVFDKTDVPEFHIEKVTINKDFTIIQCTYAAEASSWANISDSTYLFDTKTNKSYPLQKSEGFPFAPEQRTFIFAERCEIKLFFPSFNPGGKLDLIEKKDARAFNVYGIDLNSHFEKQYQESELKRFSNMASFYDSAKDTLKAIQYKKDELLATQYIHGMKSEAYMLSLLQLSRMYNKYENPFEAIKLMEMGTKLYAETWGMYDKNYASQIWTLANFYSHAKMYDQAIKYYKESIALYEKLNIIDEGYALVLGFIADVYNEIGDESKSIMYQKKAISARREIGESDKYIDELFMMLTEGNSIDRINIVENEIDNIPLFVDTISFSYTNILKTLASSLEIIGDYAKANKYCDKCLSILQSDKKNNQIRIAEIAGYKCRYLSRLGFIRESIEWGEKAKSALDSLQVYPDVYNVILDEMARDFANLYDYEMAIKYQEQSAQLYETLGDWISLAGSLQYIGSYYKEKKDLDKAEEYLKKAISIIYCHDDAEDIYLAKMRNRGQTVIQRPSLRDLYPINMHINTVKYGCLNELGSVYSQKKDYEAAINAIKESGEIIKEYGDLEVYVINRLNLSQYYAFNNQLEEAINISQESIELIKELKPIKESGIINEYLAVANENLGVFYYKMNEKEQAIASLLKALTISVNSSNFDLISNIKIFLSSIYKENREYKKAEECLSSVVDCAQMIIRKDFSTMKTEQKQRLWAKYEPFFYFYRTLTEESEWDEKTISKLFDYTLFSKSLLLASYNANDEEINKRLSINWKDIQKELSEHDLAIEFISTAEDSLFTTYHALVIDKTCKYPNLITLYKESDFYKIKQTSTKQVIDILGDLIWKPILRQYTNIENVYFSPDGIIHRLPIEYSNVEGIGEMMDHYNLYRLSSTKDIIYHNNRKSKNHAILYGGLDYDGLSKESTQNTDESYYALLRGINARGGFEPLYSTYEEVKEISDLLDDMHISTRLFTGTDGTEDSFKALSGKDINILHLSTHGMYVGPSIVEQTRKENNFDFLKLLNNKNDPVKEDIVLTHSFLVMSYGNKLTHRETISNSSDDGILTAFEISYIDLSKVDLVVLSACETGLGDLDYGGIYGLQRGFKKAGVNTILMSLDKVDDEATKILMVEFYKNMMNGKSKHQSLKDAQKFLRQVENGKYDKPEYWASFILLDGLN